MLQGRQRKIDEAMKMADDSVPKKRKGSEKSVEAAKRNDRLEGIKKGYRKTEGFEPSQSGRGALRKDDEIRQRAREGRVIDNSLLYR